MTSLSTDFGISIIQSLYHKYPCLENDTSDPRSKKVTSIPTFALCSILINKMLIIANSDEIPRSMKQKSFILLQFIEDKICAYMDWYLTLDELSTKNAFGLSLIQNKACKQLLVHFYNGAFKAIKEMNEVTPISYSSMVDTSEPEILVLELFFRFKCYAARLSTYKIIIDSIVVEKWYDIMKFQRAMKQLASLCPYDHPIVSAYCFKQSSSSSSIPTTRAFRKQQS